MVSAEVQRTLVKSPPELWSELSDPASLTRHLGELGEIRITRMDPEKSLEWEAEEARGTVAIKSSGWGTRVTLTVLRELPELQQPPPIGSSGEEGSAQEQDEPSHERTAHGQPTDAIEPACAGQAPACIEPAAPAVDGEERKAGEDHAPDEELTPGAQREPLRAGRFFARLFRRRRTAAAPTNAAEAGPQAEGPGEPQARPGEPATEAGKRAVAWRAPRRAELSPAPPNDTQREPREEPPPGPSPAAATATQVQLRDAPLPPGTEASTGAQTAAAQQAGEAGAADAAAAALTAVLTAALDRLGAAHHRPFSRA